MPSFGTGFRRVVGCAVAGLLSLAGPAFTGGVSAAPMAAAASNAQWTGFYAGGELGGAWSKFDWTYTNPNYFNTIGATLLGSDFNQNASGLIGSIFAGYNYSVRAVGARHRDLGGRQQS